MIPVHLQRHRDWLIYMRPFSAVLRCLPIFCNVRCDRSILVCSVLRNFALLSLSFFGTCNSAGRSTCHLCSAVLICFSSFLHCSLWLVGSRATLALQRYCLSQFFAMLTAIGSSTCRLLITSYFGLRCFECSLLATTC